MPLNVSSTRSSLDGSADNRTTKMNIERKSMEQS